MANLEEKKIAGQILAAYLGREKANNPFDKITPKEYQFEPLWDRVLKKVSES